MKKYLIEAMGTFFLVLTIGLTVGLAQPLAPLAIGSVLAVMVYMGGYISGAHYNPAVTLAIRVRKKIGTEEALKYVASQLVGAFLAALMVYLLINQPLYIAPGAGYGRWKVMLAEGLFTFALASVVLHVATAKKTDPNHYFGLAIGFTVFAGAVAVGSISGGVFNPAVAIGPMLLDALLGGVSISTIRIYLLGTLLGGAAAGYLYNFIEKE